jgi:hypothetical protein
MQQIESITEVHYGVIDVSADCVLVADYTFVQTDDLEMSLFAQVVSLRRNHGRTSRDELEAEMRRSKRG